MEAGVKINKAWSLFLILLMSSGCIFVPVPQPSEQGDQIDELLDRLVVGNTTKKEVISIMGEPDETSDNSIVYWHREYSGGYRGYYVYDRKPLKLSSGEIGVKEIEPQSSYVDLFFEFDGQGILARHRVGNDDVREAYGFPAPSPSPYNGTMTREVRCYTGCTDRYHSCVNSDVEGHTCEEDKRICSKSCQKAQRLRREGGDLCLKWETGKYVPCDEPAN